MIRPLLLVLFLASRAAAFSCGDVNGDNVVNVGDALIVAQFDVGLVSCTNPGPAFRHPELCDVNGDNACNIGDALKLAQCDVGVVSCSFTCGSFSCPTTTTTLTTTTTSTTTTTVTTTSTTTTTVATTTTTSGSSTTTTTLSARLIGFVPQTGTAADVVVDSSTHRAYLSNAEFGLVTLTYATPSSSAVLGGSNPPFLGGHGMAQSGNIAVVATLKPNGGLFVVDVSNPAIPLTVGKVSGSFNNGQVGGVAMVSSTTAYVIETVAGNPATTQLDTVNLTTPSAPVVTGHVVLSNGGNCVTVSGTFAYVGTSAGLQIVDVSGATPVLRGTLVLGSPMRSSALVGTKLYIGTDGGFQIADVTNPDAPTPVVSAPSIGAVSVAAHGTTVYTLSGTLFHTVDVSTPTNPTVQATLALTKGGTGLAQSNGTTVVISSTDSVSVIDVTSPAMPAFVKVIPNGLMVEPDGVAVAGTIGVATGGPTGLRVVDLSAPATPTLVGALLPSHIAGTFGAIAQSGNYAYVDETVPGNPATQRISVIDLTTPATPANVANTGTLTRGAAGLTIAGTVLYAAKGDSLQTFDISTPGAISSLGTVAMPSPALQVAISGTHAYVADGSSVQIVDVSNPAAPSVVATLTGTGASASQAVRVSGSKLYILGGNIFAVYGLGAPLAPNLLGSIFYQQGPPDLAIISNTVLLTEPAILSAMVADVTNPASIQTRANLLTPGANRTITTDGTYFYGVDVAGTIDVFQPVP